MKMTDNRNKINWKKKIVAMIVTLAMLSFAVPSMALTINDEAYTTQGDSFGASDGVAAGDINASNSIGSGEGVAEGGSAGVAAPGAAESEPEILVVGGVEMTDGDYLANGADAVSDKAPEEGGYAYYAEGVLVLDSYVYEGEGYNYSNDERKNKEGGVEKFYYYAAIYTNTEIDIVLKGENSIVLVDKEDTAEEFHRINGIRTRADISISGDGKIYIEASNIGISAFQTILIDGGSYEIKTGNDCIATVGDMIINRGEFDLTVHDLNGNRYSNKNCISATNNLSINGGSFNLVAKDAGGMLAKGDVLRIFDCEINIKLTGDSSGNYAIRSLGDIIILNSKIDVTTQNSAAIESSNGMTVIWGWHTEMTLRTAPSQDGTPENYKPIEYETIKIIDCLKVKYDTDSSSAEWITTISCDLTFASVTVGSKEQPYDAENDYYFADGEWSDSKPSTDSYAHVKGSTLTLHNLKLNDEILIYGPYNIVLEGKNVLTADNGRYTGIFSYCSNLTISGGGSLKVVCDTYSGYGIVCLYGNLTIDGCEIEFDAYYGVYQECGNIVIKNSKIKTTSMQSGLYSDGNIIIENSSVDITVTECEDEDIGGIYTYGFTILVNDSNVKLVTSGCDGMLCMGEIIVLDSVIDIISDADGMDGGCDITVLGSTINISADSDGINGSEDITIADSTITIRTEKNDGFDVDDNLKIISSKLDITAYDADGIDDDDGNVVIIDSIVIIKAGDNGIEVDDCDLKIIGGDIEIYAAEMPIYVEEGEIYIDGHIVLPDKGSIGTVVVEYPEEDLTENIKIILDKNGNVAKHVIIFLEKREASFDGIIAADGTYNGKAYVGFEGALPSIYGSEIEIHYVGRNGTVYDSAAAPVNAGDYTVIISIPEDNMIYDGSIELNFTIKKKLLSVAWLKTNFTYDGEEKCPTVRIRGLIEGDECEAIIVGGATEGGEYTARIAELSNGNYYVSERMSETEFTIINTAAVVDGAVDRIVECFFENVVKPTIKNLLGNIFSALLGR